MILKIRSSKTFKVTCVYLILNILFEIISPMQLFALTGGPSQPEFSTFTPVGTDEMVDLSSGDFSYNIPLLDVGGYPINIAYSSNVSMDQEASYTGLGWNLSIGQINHNVRGLPDDFKGDPIEYKEFMKPNFTISGSFRITPNIFGKNLSKEDIAKLTTGEQNEHAGNVTKGITVSYNNYNGLEIKPSFSTSKTFNDVVSIGFSAESSKDGISVEPYISLDRKSNELKKYNYDLGANAGCVYNSRQGLSEWSLNVSKKANIALSNKYLEKINSKTNGSLGSKIDFVDPVYTPSVRNGINTEVVNYNAALGSEFFGGEAQGQIGAVVTIQSILPYNQVREVPAYGYVNTNDANRNSVLDFNREKETPISSNTVNLPVTNYTYDIHTIQGQGISGMYRPYRGKLDYVYDSYSSDLNLTLNMGAEFGVGNAVHSGFSMGGGFVQGSSGVWSNDAIQNLYQHNYSDKLYETVYYKNVGELSYENEINSSQGLYTRTFYDSPVRYKVVGIEYFKSLSNKLLDNNETRTEITAPLYREKRKPRNQFIKHYSYEELKKLKTVNKRVDNPFLDLSNLPSHMKDHHVGMIEVTKNDGVVYTYGLPAYNLTKQEVTFSVSGKPNAYGNISYDNTIAEAFTGNGREQFKNLPYNKNLQSTKTPAYVHTHMITSIKSSDYIDVKNDGYSEDDLGNYTFFKYSSYKEVTKNKASTYKWRVPYGANEASYNEGLKTDTRDDQGNIIYGEKELYFVKEIHTKTHVAVFELNNPSTNMREDGFGVLGIHGGKNTDNPSFYLKTIKLYTLSDYKKLQNGEQISPQKTVHFEYDYSLCKGVRNGNTGKLTLKSIYYTYRDSKMGKYSKYVFHYDTPNPDFHEKGYDCWGNYKKYTNSTSDIYANTANRLSTEFTHVEQDDSLQDERAQSWLLSSIETPSGGEINIHYESDDYAYVQNAKINRMYKVVGACSNSELSSFSYSGAQSAELYTKQSDHKEFLLVELPNSERNNKDLLLENIKSQENLMQFRFLMNMTKSGNNNETSNDYDYVYSYCKIDPGTSEIITKNGKQYLAIKLEMVRNEGGLIKGSPNRNPISVTGWNFARKNLNNYAYRNIDNDVVNANGFEYNVTDIAKQLFQVQTVNNLIEIFVGPNKKLENNKVAKRFIIGKSFVRLNDLSKAKKGGGARVASIKTSDKWAEMTSDTQGKSVYKTKEYGQIYSYKLDDAENESQASSSGVATYEPLGNKENPFIQPIKLTTKHLLAPSDVNYMETPYGESFFPSPQVTYRRVTVRSYSNNENQLTFDTSHGTGKVVSEFYTTYDFPTKLNRTSLDPKPKLGNLIDNLIKLPIYSKRDFIVSQGYSVILNDMNGKLKRQDIYEEGKNTPISGVKYIYNLADFSNPDTRLTTMFPNGQLSQSYLGVEIDLVHDFREAVTSSKFITLDANVGSFLFGFFPFVLPTVFGKLKMNDNNLRTSTSTKVVNRFGVLKETIAYDNGTSVSTKNLAWDGLTGEVLLTETTNEFNDSYYSLNYPAHWAYDGMGQISKNLGYTVDLKLKSGTSIYTKLDGGKDENLIEGDEVLLEEFKPNQPVKTVRAWVLENKNGDIKFIDIDGVYISHLTNVLLTVIKSGRKNLQSAGVLNVTLKQNPLIDIYTGNRLNFINKNFLINKNSDFSKADYRVLNATGVLYSDYWPATCECSGITPSANPYVTNTKGIWRTKASYTYLAKRNYDANANSRNTGYFETFNPMYRIDSKGKFYYELSNWTYVSQVSRYAPVGTELENKDALNRKSSALYGYNNKLPIAVGANTAYGELAYDGFEDYDFNSCIQNNHFGFKNASVTGIRLNSNKAHTGKTSAIVTSGSKVNITNKIKCGVKSKKVIKSIANDKNCDKKIELLGYYRRW
jgi:hypothetical protein